MPIRLVRYEFEVGLVSAVLNPQLSRTRCRSALQVTDLRSTRRFPVLVSDRHWPFALGVRFGVDPLSRTKFNSWPPH